MHPIHPSQECVRVCNCNVVKRHTITHLAPYRATLRCGYGDVRWRRLIGAPHTTDMYIYINTVNKRTSARVFVSSTTTFNEVASQYVDVGWLSPSSISWWRWRWTNREQHCAQRSNVISGLMVFQLFVNPPRTNGFCAFLLCVYVAMCVFL